MSCALIGLGAFAYSAVGATVLVVLVLMLYERGTGLAELSEARAVRLDGLPGTPTSVKTASDGSLWVSTMFRGSLCRRADGQWQVFRGSEFGTRSNYPADGFVLDGTTAWTVIDRVLLRYDGRRWQPVAGIPFSQPVRGIAAINGRPWVLSAGRIAVFDGRVWTQESPGARLAGFPRDDDARWENAGLQATADGSLWLAVGGLWRRQKDQWSAASIEGRGLIAPKIVGCEGGRLWLADGRRLCWTTPDGQDQGSWDYDAMGLDSGEEVGAVAIHDGRWTVSTGTRVLQRQGDGWKPLCSRELTEGRFAGFQQLASASGRLYAVVHEPFPLGWLAAACGAAIGIAVVAIALLRAHLPCPAGSLAGFRRALLFPLAVIIVGLVVETLGRPAAGGENRWIFGLALLAMAAIVAPALYTVYRLSPVALAACLHGFRGSPEPQRFDPVDDSAVPAAAVSYFNSGQPLLESLGFRRIGQYRLKTRTPHFARSFYHPELGAFANLEWCRVFLSEISNCGFSALLSDGTYLETGNAREGQTKHAGRLQLRSFPGLTPERLLQRHLEEAAELERQRGCAPFPVRPESLASLSSYGLKLSYDDMVERGIATSNPYHDLDTMALMREIVGDGASGSPADAAIGYPRDAASP